MIGVVLVDDDALMRAGLRMILEQTDDITVVGEADDGTTALGVVQRMRPDVVLMDVRMPELDGIAATERILARPSPPKVVVLTTFELDDYVFDALAADASGFLLKRTPPEQLVQSIREVVAGGSMLSPTVTTRVIERFSRRRPPAPTLPGSGSSPTASATSCGRWRVGCRTARSRPSCSSGRTPSRPMSGGCSSSWVPATARRRS